MYLGKKDSGTNISLSNITFLPKMILGYLESCWNPKAKT